MSENSLGRAAYEALQTAFPSEDWGPWDVLDEDDQLGWEAIAQTAINAHRAQIDEVVYSENIALRALVAEILAALGPRPNDISNPQIAKWRQRAGLEG